MAAKVEAIISDDTLWLTQAQLVMLFESSKANISEHIKHIFQSGELDKISVGYRVNSIRGTQFRIWANKVLKDYLLKGYSLNNRMNRIEDNVKTLSDKVNEIDVQINSNLPPNQGIFYDGQVFDAYVFAADLVKTAKTSILLIDNYVDESVLQLFTKRKKNVSVKIYTKTISNTLKQDLQKHNAQYTKIEIEKFTKAHDRTDKKKQKRTKIQLFNILRLIKDEKLYLYITIPFPDSWM